MTVDVDEVLTTAFDGLAPLHQPVMVIALTGWFDAAGAATDALDALLGDRVRPVVAAIDPDPFFDFTQERPSVELDDDGMRTIRWPENEFRLMRRPGEPHDVVALCGVEPHLRYGTFADAVLRVVGDLRCELVVTVGAAADAVPHTRTPAVVGSSTNPALARALGLASPQYQGVTGLIGVLQERLDRAAVPAISLRVGVPHYLGNVKHPRAAAALVHQIGRIIGITTSTESLDAAVEQWRIAHDEAIGDDPEALAYVAGLERRYDHHVEAVASSGDDLAAELERFLRDQT